MKEPTVSIGLPVYNGESFLAEAIESILAQEFADLELVISDNASSDATEEICREYVKRDPRVSYSSVPENRGAAQNYNRAFALSSGKYFKWAAHDDLLRPEFLRRCVEAHSAAERAGRTVAIVHPRAAFIDDAGLTVGLDRDRMHAVSRWPALRVFRALQSMNMAGPIFGLMPRELVGRTSLIRSFAASDYAFLVEAAMLGEIAQLDDVLFLRRVHAGMSRKANTTNADVLRWFDPAARTRLSIRQRLYLEYVRSTSSLRAVSPLNRGACTVAAISGVLVRRSRVNAGRVRRQIVGSLHR